MRRECKTYRADDDKMVTLVFLRPEGKRADVLLALFPSKEGSALSTLSRHRVITQRTQRSAAKFQIWRGAVLVIR